MRLHRAPDGKDDRGATLVEFALIAPIFFLMIGAMLDMGLAVLGRSVASNAAREGARTGIISFEGADIPNSPNNVKIKAKVAGKLVGLIDPDASDYVVVRCLDGRTKATINCTRAEVEIDEDLIEVSVIWKSISPSGGVFTSDHYTNVARMVITGGPTGLTGSCGTAPTLAWGSSAYSTNELNADHTMPITVTRSGNLTCPTTLVYNSGGGTATPGSDYTAEVNEPITFAPGQGTWSGDVTILGDSVKETPKTETFDLTMNSGSVSNGSIPSPTATATITDDDLDTKAPGLKTLTLKDNDKDGKIDQLVATFDEDLVGTCTNQGAVTFPTKNGPGVTVVANGITIDTSTDTVTISLNEGGTPSAIDTSNSNLLVNLAGNCVQDADGNSATLTDEKPLDGASPVLRSVTPFNVGSTAGKFEATDYLEFAFSEPMASASIPATTTVSLISGNGNNSDKLASVLFTSDVALNADYISGNNKTASFANSSITYPAGTSTVRLTLGTCSGDCGSVTTAAAASSMTFSLDTSLHGATDNLGIVQPTITATLKLF